MDNNIRGAVQAPSDAPLEALEGFGEVAQGSVLPQVLTVDGRVLVERLRLAESHWDKFRGLMMDDSLQANEALLIRRCKSIHCCFMKIPIDVLFVDRDGNIVHIIEEMRPWTFSPIVKGASDVIECYPGTVRRYGLEDGQKLMVTGPRGHK